MLVLKTACLFCIILGPTFCGHVGQGASTLLAREGLNGWLCTELGIVKGFLDYLFFLGLEPGPAGVLGAGGASTSFLGASFGVGAAGGLGAVGAINDGWSGASFLVLGWGNLALGTALGMDGVHLGLHGTWGNRRSWSWSFRHCLLEQACYPSGLQEILAAVLQVKEFSWSGLGSAGWD